MTAKLIIRRRTHDGMVQDGSRDMEISLPAPPFQLDVTSDRPETEPRTLTVRGNVPKRSSRNLERLAKITAPIASADDGLLPLDKLIR